MRNPRERGAAPVRPRHDRYGADRRLRLRTWPGDALYGRVGADPVAARSRRHPSFLPPGGGRAAAIAGDDRAPTRRHDWANRGYEPFDNWRRSWDSAGEPASGTCRICLPLRIMYSGGSAARGTVWPRLDHQYAPTHRGELPAGVAVTEQGARWNAGGKPPAEMKRCTSRRPPRDASASNAAGARTGAFCRRRRHVRRRRCDLPSRQGP